MSRAFPIRDGQDGDHEDEGSDATGEDGDAYGHPERRAGNDHRDDTHGRRGGGEEDGHHAPTPCLIGSVGDPSRPPQRGGGPAGIIAAREALPSFGGGGGGSQ